MFFIDILLFSHRQGVARIKIGASVFLLSLSCQDEAIGRAFKIGTERAPRKQDSDLETKPCDPV